MRDTNAEPVSRAILRLAGPACLTFLLQNAYHVNDAFFLGRHSPASTNAMGLFMFVMITNFGFILALARGTQSLMARRFGAGQPEAAATTLARGLTLALKVALPLAALEWWFAPETAGSHGRQRRSGGGRHGLPAHLDPVHAVPVLRADDRLSPSRGWATRSHPSGWVVSASW